MKCILPGHHIRIFGKSIHCLSKIGDELYIEGLDEGLTLRTVNSSRSAYGCFHFADSFFLEYTNQLEDNTRNGSVDQDEHLRLKISMKSCLAIFKSLANLEKGVDHCKIVYEESESRLVFILFCKFGIVKTHNLTFQECESLQAIFSKELCQNMIRSSARVLQDCVVNFPTNCEEICLSVCPQNIKFKNYVEDESDLSKVVQTEMTLSPDEFEDCRIGIDTDITFCLKEFRAILGFSEAINQPVNIHFQTGGKPIAFAMDGENTFTAEFVLASLTDSPSESQQALMSQGQPSADVNTSKAQETSYQKNSRKISRKNMPSGSVEANTAMENEEVARNTGHSRTENFGNRLIHGAPNDARVPGNGEAISVANNEHNASGVSLQQDDFFSDSFPYKDMFSDNSKGGRDIGMEKSQSNNHSLVGRWLDTSGRSARPASTPRSSQRGHNMSKISLPKIGDSFTNEGSISDGDDVDDCVPGTPPAKRYKSMLFGAESEQTEQGDQMILAPDTDEDE